MNYSPRSLFASLLVCVALVGCASQHTKAAPKALGYDLRIEGNRVALSFDRDLTVPEFLQLAQQVTSAVYVFQKEEVAAFGPVSLQGRIDCERGEFPIFVSTMLNARGLRADTKRDGVMEYVEVSPVVKNERT